MPALSDDTVRKLLEPYLAPFAPALSLSDAVVGQVQTYLDLLIRWNSRVNLTAIRRPEEMIERHFGESFFTAGHLVTRLTPNSELLDFGSGPGFPGLPIQILLPHLRVTAAESQARKVAFLLEVIRTVGLTAEVWPHRVEQMPADRLFDAVTLRAVEKMESVLTAASARVRETGWIAALVGTGLELPGAEEWLIPGSERRRLLLCRNVPRGTSHLNLL